MQGFDLVKLVPYELTGQQSFPFCLHGASIWFVAITEPFHLFRLGACSKTIRKLHSVLSVHFKHWIPMTFTSHLILCGQRGAVVLQKERLHRGSSVCLATSLEPEHGTVEEPFLDLALHIKQPISLHCSIVTGIWHPYLQCHEPHTFKYIYWKLYPIHVV